MTPDDLTAAATGVPVGDAVGVPRDRLARRRPRPGLGLGQSEWNTAACPALVE